MSYFAADYTVSTSQIEGGVEITEAQYQMGIEAMTSGKEIIVIDGEMVIRGPKPSPNHEWINGEWVDTTPDPEPTPDPEIIPYPSITASAKLTVDDGIMNGFTTDSRIAGGFQLDVGKYMLFFKEPILSPYIVSAFDGGLFRIYVDPNDYAEDYFIVTCTDLTGSPSDPENLSVIIITT